MKTMIAKRTEVPKEILQALDLLGGYATVDQLIVRTGYCRDWTVKQVQNLLIDGILQRSALMPYIYSRAGGPLTKREIIPGTRDGLIALTKQYLHWTGDTTPALRYALRDKRHVPTLESIQKIAELAGYEIILVPKKDFAE
jgi:hypothetical protein